MSIRILNGETLILSEKKGTFYIYKNSEETSGVLLAENVIDSKDSFESAVHSLLNDYDGDFKILDFENEHEIFIESKKAVDLSHFDNHIHRVDADPSVAKLWGLEISPREEYEEVDCSHCGDGGCVYCDPGMFL